MSHVSRLAATVVLATVVLACSSSGPDTAGSDTRPGASASSSSASTAASSETAPDPTASTSPPDAGTGPPVELSSFGPTDVVTLPLDEWDVRVDWPQDPEGTDLADYLADHPDVTVLTNAGIFSTDLTPGGLLVADGEVLRDLNLADGVGNFHLEPNAVFAVHDDGTASVVDSTAHEPAGVRQATQSGPALLLDGDVHPEFREGSENVAYRSGVGVSPDGRTVYLAITNQRVNLWDFATTFRDDLGVDDALYLDGQISQVWIDGVTDEPLPYLGPYAGVIAVSPR